MTIAKSITALVMGLLMMFLSQFGVTPDMPFVDVIGILVTTVAVYWIPNKGVDA